MTRLLGLDPGLRHTGWGVLDSDGPRLRFVACGTVDSNAADPIASRLRGLYDGLEAMIARLEPVEAAVEETVVNVNALTSLQLGHARGVVVLAAARAGLAVSEYAASRVKRAVAGTGRASKEQVAMMVRALLPGAGDARPDAMDALAVAICHAHTRATLARLVPGRRLATGAA
jgi:crossover junction endodeoxyribonuclease RuvC